MKRRLYQDAVTKRFITRVEWERQQLAQVKQKGQEAKAKTPPVDKGVEQSRRGITKALPRSDADKLKSSAPAKTKKGKANANPAPRNRAKASKAPEVTVSRKAKTPPRLVERKPAKLKVKGAAKKPPKRYEGSKKSPAPVGAKKPKQPKQSKAPPSDTIFASDLEELRREIHKRRRDLIELEEAYRLAEEAEKASSKAEQEDKAEEEQEYQDALLAEQEAVEQAGLEVELAEGVEAPRPYQQEKVLAFIFETATNMASLCQSDGFDAKASIHENTDETIDAECRVYLHRGQSVYECLEAMQGGIREMSPGTFVRITIIRPANDREGFTKSDRVRIGGRYAGVINTKWRNHRYERQLHMIVAAIQMDDEKHEKQRRRKAEQVLYVWHWTPDGKKPDV